jgi:hypothetical protein
LRIKAAIFFSIAANSGRAWFHVYLNRAAVDGAGTRFISCRIEENPMTTVETARKRDPFRKALKLDALRKKQDAIKAKIAKLEARQKEMAHKEDARLKAIVGAAILANVNLIPETRPGVVAILEKTVAARRDREFLRAKNWL